MAQLEWYTANLPASQAVYVGGAMQTVPTAKATSLEPLIKSPVSQLLEP